MSRNDFYFYTHYFQQRKRVYPKFKHPKVPTLAEFCPTCWGPRNEDHTDFDHTPDCDRDVAKQIGCYDPEDYDDEGPVRKVFDF